MIYETPESRTLWGSWGTNVLYLGPSLNRYQCNHYFVPETCAYCISGSAETIKHLQEVITELVTMFNELPPKKQARVLTKSQQKLASSD